MSSPLIAIVGAGPGVGLAVARKFGAKGFRVVLLARRKEALDSYTAELKGQHIEAYGVTADASDTVSLNEAFREIKEKYGAPEVLVYNAAALNKGTPSTFDEEALLSGFKANVIGGWTSAAQVLPDLIERKQGTILFTGGGFALSPSADYASLSLGKAALRSLAFTLAEENEPHGIFVGTVTIAGYVKPGTYFDPDRIAEAYWTLHEDRKEREIVFQES